MSKEASPSARRIETYPGYFPPPKSKPTTYITLVFAGVFCTRRNYRALHCDRVTAIGGSVGRRDPNTEEFLPHSESRSHSMAQ